MLRALAVLFLALAWWPATARAAVVYDTFALGQGGSSIILGQFMGNDLQYAYPFDMPLAGNAPLDRITLRLRHSPDVGAVRGEFTLRLREDDGGEPGAVLESWTFTDDLIPETNVVFDSVTQPALLAGETYWLNLKIEAGTGMGLWLGAVPETEDFLFALTGALDPDWDPPTGPFPIGLATVEVPEPAHAWLVVAGAAVLAPFGRRRTRA